MSRNETDFEASLSFSCRKHWTWCIILVTLQSVHFQFLTCKAAYVGYGHSLGWEHSIWFVVVKTKGRQFTLQTQQLSGLCGQHNPYYFPSDFLLATPLTLVKKHRNLTGCHHCLVSRTGLNMAHLHPTITRSYPSVPPSPSFYKARKEVSVMPLSPSKGNFSGGTFVLLQCFTFSCLKSYYIA